MARVQVVNLWLGAKMLRFYCVGCGFAHGAHIANMESGMQKTLCTWNGNTELPTIYERITVTYPPEKGRLWHKCAFSVKNGRISYSDDCTHAAAGTTISLPEIETQRQ